MYSSHSFKNPSYCLSAMSSCFRYHYNVKGFWLPTLIELNSFLTFPNCKQWARTYKLLLDILNIYSIFYFYLDDKIIVYVPLHVLSPALILQLIWPVNSCIPAECLNQCNCAECFISPYNENVLESLQFADRHNRRCCLTYSPSCSGPSG